ncbi:MAG: hypothetical protein ACK526_10940 [Planctomyces sp.]
MSRVTRGSKSRREKAGDSAFSPSFDERPDRMIPILLFIVTFVMCCFPLRDLDFWWHLRTGELILERGMVPFKDCFTYMDSSQPWIDMHWGFQILIVFIHRTFGVNGVIIGKALLYTAAVFIGWKATGSRLSVTRRAVIWFPAIVAITGRANERPEMMTMLFLATALYLAERPSLICRRRWLWPLLCLCWVNFHALYILGIVVWAAVVFELCCRQAASRYATITSQTESYPGLTLRTAAWISVLMLACLLLNPYTIEGLKFPFVLYQKFSVEKDFYSVRIGEFRPPLMFLSSLVQRYGLVPGIIAACINLYFTAEVVLFVIGCVTFVRAIRNRTLRIYRLVLFVGFSHLAWVATRNTGVFAIVAAVMACGNEEEILRKAVVSVAGSRMSSVFRRRLVAIGLVLQCIFFVSGEWGLLVEKWKVFGFGEATHWFGHEAMKFCARDGMPRRAFITHIGLAGTYIYHNGPDRKVFMDPRLEVCSRKTFEKFDLVQAGVFGGRPGWEKIINPDEGEMPVVILDATSIRQSAPLISANTGLPPINGDRSEPFWRLVYADSTAAVFLTVPQADAPGFREVSPSLLFEATQ